MARGDVTAFTQTLTSALPRDLIQKEAKKRGIIVRDRKLDVFSLVVTMVLSFQDGSRRSLAALQRSYEGITGTSMVRSAFYKRLNAKLAGLLKFLVNVSFLKLTESRRGVPAGILAGFKDLLAVDATVVQLHRLLEQLYPVSRTNSSKAAAKLHTLINVQDGTPRRIHLSPERGNERGPWRNLGPWINGSLLLFDLGYFHYALFDRIDRMGGFLISRLKKNANPTIKSLNTPSIGRAITVEGERLLDVLHRLKRRTLDAQVEVVFERRGFGRKRVELRREFRLVAIRNDETGEYHCYVTNLPVERMQAEDIAKVYALRWQIELLFKAMKSHGHLEQIPSSKPHIVECMIWASVLSLILSRTLFLFIRRAIPIERAVPLLRWAAVFGQFARDIMRMLIDPRTVRKAMLLRTLMRQAVDPNRTRRDRALDGLVAWDAA